METLNLDSLIKEIKEPWQPIEIIRMDNLRLIISKFEGEYNFHKHNCDELFWVYRGEIEIETEDKTYFLKENDFLLVPAWVVHRSSAQNQSFVLMLEKADIKTYFIEKEK